MTTRTQRVPTCEALPASSPSRRSLGTYADELAKRYTNEDLGPSPSSVWDSRLLRASEYKSVVASRKSNRSPSFITIDPTNAGIKFVVANCAGRRGDRSRRATRGTRTCSLISAMGPTRQCSRLFVKSYVKAAASSLYDGLAAATSRYADIPYKPVHLRPIWPLECRGSKGLQLCPGRALRSAAASPRSYARL